MPQPGTTDFWLALTAGATLLLALATLYLGWQTRGMTNETRVLAQTTSDEIELLRKQTAAAEEGSSAQRQTLEELRETRIAEFLPVLHWQDPNLGGSTTGDGRVDLKINVVVRNAGRGPARILAFEPSVPDGSIAAIGLAIPSTVPANEPFTLSMLWRRQYIAGRAEIRVRLRYADLPRVREYETKVRIVIEIQRPSDMQVVEFDSDERSAEERRV